MPKLVTSLTQKDHLRLRIHAADVYKKKMERYLALKSIPEKKRPEGFAGQIADLKEYFDHYNRKPAVRASNKEEDPHPAGFLRHLWQLVVSRREPFFFGSGGKKRDDE